MYPIIIEYTGPHGLEPSAVEGVDYCKYKVVYNDLGLPKDASFKIIATNVWIAEVN